MKTELRVIDHAEVPGQKVVELWYDGKFVGALYGADGPGFRLFTRLKPVREFVADAGQGINVVQVNLEAPR